MGMWWMNALSFVDILFTKLTTKIKVDDQIDVFGILRFDADRNVFFIDKPIAFFKSSLESFDKIKSWLWWKNLWQSFKLSFKLVFWGTVTLCGFYFSFCMFKLLQYNIRHQNQRRHREMRDLLNRQQNQRGLPNAQDIENKMITIDSYKCRNCEQKGQVSVREIVNVPCMHMYSCNKCFREKNIEGQFQCEVCNQ